jgi:RNA polymerase sigma-70 factor (ECF subfamily)
MDTSASLLERLRQPGEEAAWRRFVELYTPLLFSWARKAGLGDADAADLVQDVFALLVQKLPEFVYDRQKSFRGWLRTVTLNRWREKHRRQRPAGELGGSADEVAGPNSVAAFWEQDYRQHLVGRAMEMMQNEFQPATWKACWELVVAERPAPEVAAELGLTVNAVYLAKSRVLRHLRRELAGLLD